MAKFRPKALSGGQKRVKAKLWFWPIRGALGGIFVSAIWLYPILAAAHKTDTLKHHIFKGSKGCLQRVKAVNDTRPPLACLVHHKKERRMTPTAVIEPLSTKSGKTNYETVVVV